MRALTLTGAVALVAFAGACTKPVHVDGQAQPVTPAPSATSATPAPAVTTAKPTVAPSRSSATSRATTARTTTRADNPCPVSAGTLLETLRKTPVFDQAGHPDGLTRPTCYQGYAYAKSTYEVPPQAERPWVLFKYNTKADRWTAITLGTGGVCDGYAPESVQDRLNENGNSGC